MYHYSSIRTIRIGLDSGPSSLTLYPKMDIGCVWPGYTHILMLCGHGDLREGPDCLVCSTNRSEIYLHLEVTLSHSSGLSSDSFRNILFSNIKVPTGTFTNIQVGWLWLHLLSWIVESCGVLELRGCRLVFFLSCHIASEPEFLWADPCSHWWGGGGACER